MKHKGFTLAGGFCGAWQGASPNTVSEQSVDDCEPAIIQEEAQAGVEGKSLLLPETVDRRRRIIEPVKRQRSVVLQWRDTHRSHKEAFTLAEVLITLAIIGVVAAIAIPSVISNSQQQEFKTGLRKAVSVLNSAITMNMALDGETPYDNANLYGFLMKHMAVIKSATDVTSELFSVISYDTSGGAYRNVAFYTTDGMRFELRKGGTMYDNYFPLYENNQIYVCMRGVAAELNYQGITCGGCGSYGLNSNSDNTTKPPCLVMVDVNGDKKPNPNNVNCKSSTCAKPYKFSDAKGTKLTDLFSVMITDKSAIPYGVAAQRAMYQARK